MLTRAAALAALSLVLAACAPQGAQDDPVMQPPDDGLTEAAAQPAEVGEDETPGPTPGTPADAGDGGLPDDAWTPRAAAPTALTEVAAAPFGGSVWTAGGFDADGEAVATVLIYDPTFDSWQEGPELPQAVHHASLVSTGDALYLLGGYTGSDFAAPSGDVVVLDAATGEWTEGPPLPEPRAAGAAAWDGERVVYGGGVGPDGLADGVWVLEGDDWRALGELSEAREHLAAASDGSGRVWFLGGRTDGLETNLTAVDLVEAEVVERIGDLPTARGGVAGLYLPAAGGCAIGGEEPTGTFAEVECMDAEGAVSSLPALTEARHGLGAAVVEGVAYAVLGGPEPGLAVSPVIEALALSAG